MNMRHLRAAVVAVVMAGALVLAGCGNGGTEGAAPPTGPDATLRIGATAEPPTMDPTVNNAAAIPQVLLYNVYETLVRIDGEGEMQPLLAESWDVSEDRSTYTFHLVPDATFASGNPVRAEDVVWSLERIRDDAAIGEVLKTQMSVIDTVAATDEHTVEVSLSRPSNAWLYDMTSTAGIVIDSEAADDLATVPAGSGPFTMTNWAKGSEISLERNDDYWGEAAGIAGATFRYYSDANAMNSAMLSGDLDVISNVQAPQALDRFGDTSQFTVLEGTTNGEVVLGMNNRSEGLDDPQVRQAIRHAIDRQALMDSVWNGKGTLIGTMVPPSDPWYEDRSGDYPYDPERAKELLAEAGYADGLSLRLRVPTLAYAQGAGQFIQSQLGAVGITVQIDEVEFPARWIDVVMQQSDYDLTIVSHVEPRDIVNYADPEYYWHYDSEEFRTAIAEADAGTEEEYVARMQDAAVMLSDDAASDWLFLLPNLIVTTPQVQGIKPNATTLSFDLTRATMGG